MSVSSLLENKSTCTNTHVQHTITYTYTQIHTTHMHTQHRILDKKVGLLQTQEVDGSMQRGRWKQAAPYLAVEQTMNEEDEGPLQAVDNGEQVRHGACHPVNLEIAQHPGTGQDEDLGNGLEGKQSGR